MEIDLKNFTSVLLFLVPGFFFVQGWKQHLPERSLTTFEETAHFFFSSFLVHLVLVIALASFIDLGAYLDTLRSGSLSEILKNHLYILVFYLVVSVCMAYYAGRALGWVSLTAVIKGVGGWTPFLAKPRLRGLNFLFSIMRQQHIPEDNRKRFVFLRLRMKDGSTYEGYLRKYTFQDDKGFYLYLRSAMLIKNGQTIDLRQEETPTDGVIVGSESISSVEVKYRD